MSPSKVYAVVLFDQAADDLGKLVTPWLKRNEMGCYIYAKKVEPNGQFFHMWLEREDPDGIKRESELQIPHRFVKAVFYAADIKTIGFL